MNLINVTDCGLADLDCLTLNEEGTKYVEKKLKIFLIVTHLRRGLDYKGTMNKTKTGKECSRWSSTEYYWVGKHNYCRNPRSREIKGGFGNRQIKKHTPEREKPWCFVRSLLSGTTQYNREWEYCDIRDCLPECDQGK